jgi:hypothetical protein
MVALNYFAVACLIVSAVYVTGCGVFCSVLRQWRSAGICAAVVAVQLCLLAVNAYFIWRVQ